MQITDNEITVGNIATVGRPLLVCYPLFSPPENCSEKLKKLCKFFGKNCANFDKNCTKMAIFIFLQKLCQVHAGSFTSVKQVVKVAFC